jgi:TP901 family phage tail tape measure protein
VSNIGKLKLEVILSAVDKMTGPLKKAISNNTQLAKTLKHSRDELKALNTQQANIEGLEKMRNSVSAAYRTAKQARQEAATSFEQAQRQANELATQFKQAQARATPQLQKYEEEKQRIVQLREAHMALQKAYKDQDAALKRVQARISKKKDASDEDKLQLSLERGKLNSLRAERHEAGRKLYTARRENNELREDMKAVLDTAKDLEKQFDAAKRTAQKLKTAHTEQAAATHQLRQSMKAAGKQFADAAQGQEHLQQRIQDANRALEAQQARLAKVNRLQAKQRAIRAKYEGALQNRDRIAGAGASAMAAGSAVGLPVLSMVKDFSAYEDAMLGIARQVEGARDAGGKLTPTYYEMGAAIRAMSQQIPMATTELAALVEGGARMGIKGKAELLAFARTAALASTAFDLPADQISEDLGKIANTYKIPIKNIAELGDTINWLDDNAQSKGADIIEVMQRIAGSTGSMSYKEAAALGSTFLSLGASSEVAATATKAMVRELAIAEKQPKRFQAGLQALGLNAKKVQADMAKDSTGTILQVMEAVKKLPATQRMGVVVDLFGKEYGDDAAKLADNLGEYRKQLALVNEQKAKGSMQREGDAKNDTLSAKYQIAQNTLFNAKAALGESLRAPAIEAMTAISGVLKSISAWTAANPQLAATLMKAAAAAAIITTVLGGLLLAVAGIIGPFIATRFAVSMVLASFTSGIGVMGRLGSAMGMVGRIMAFVFRLMLTNPVGLIVTIIGGAAIMLWQNWATIGPKFAATWQYIKDSAASLLGWFQGLPAAFVAFGGHMMDGLVLGIANGLTRVKAAITGAGESTIAWFKEKLGIHSPSRVFAQLGGWTMEGLGIGLDKGAGQPLASITQLAGKLTERAKAAMPASLGRLTATTALAGGMALQPAAAVPIDTRPPVAAQRQAAAPAAAPVYHIQIHAAPGMNETQLARLVAAELDRREREASARRRSRLGDSD